MLRLRILLQYNSPYLIILALSLLMVFFRINIIGYESIYSGEESYIEGKIVSLVKRENRYILIIDAEEKIRATYFTNENLNLELGMQIRLEGELHKPINNTIPNTFNYRRHLFNRQIYFLMRVDNLTLLENNTSIILMIRNWLNERIANFNHVGDYLGAFILGDRTGLDDEMQAAYRANGVSHLFAISGMHLNLITFLLMLGLKKIKIKSLIIILFLIFYVSLLNYAASIHRALIFAILIYLNKFFDLHIKTKNILILTCSVLIFYNPLIIFDIGFQYSAVVTFGLIISSKNDNKRYFYNLLLVSFYAFLFSVPITVFYFFEINFLAIINNLIFGPLISLIIYPLSLFTLMFRFLEPLLYMFINLTETINLFISNIDMFRVNIPKVPLVLYLLYYVLLIIYIYSNNKIYLIITILLIFSFKLKYYLDPNTYVIFFDVGQGDSTLIFNNREVILIDTGGNHNFRVSNNIMTFMRSRGISKIDLMLITHGHADHALDAPHIIQNMRVRKVMINNNEINELEEEILRVAPRVVDEYSSSFNFKIFNHLIGPSENESSIFALFSINNKTILFTGDAYRSQELRFIREHPIRIDILHIGHHGSRTSSDFNFLEQAEVIDAIISSGRNNRFNHPHPETIENLEALNIRYFNTATSGSIKYIFRRNDYTIMTFSP